MKRTGAMAVVAALVAFALATGATQATSPTPASGATWAANQRVEYRWREGAEPPAWIRGAINAAAVDSNLSRGGRAATFAHGEDGPSWIGYMDDVPSTYAIGYTVRHVPNSFTIRLRPQGYRLDWGTMRWCQFYDDPPAGCFDVELVTLHEFGHVQTLGHADESDVADWLDTVMHAGPKSKAKIGWNAHAFGRCDVARLQIRYEALTADTPYSTCLALPTELSLSASASSVEAGSSVTFTARLKIANDAIYPNLAADPLDGRTVVLQRRLPGSSGWTSVAQMQAAGGESGRYAKSLAVNATYEWRARFDIPLDDGVTASSSAPTLVTTVPACRPAPASVRFSPAYEIC